MQPFVMPEMCSTCIFRPGNLMRLREGRVEEMVADALAKDAHIICHSTLDRPRAQQQACAGFAARHDTSTLRIGRAISELHRPEGS